jgi:hypothetical protein
MGVEIDLAALWTAAGVLAGLQVTGFSFRLNREIKVAESEHITWLPPADIVNVVSLGITLVGVFIVPILQLGSSVLPLKAFGLSVLLLAGYPWVLAGHYDLYRPGHPSMLYFPAQEKIALCLLGVAAVVYIILASVR